MTTKSPNKKLESAIINECGGFEELSQKIGVSERTLKRATKDGASIKSEYLIALDDIYGIRSGSIIDNDYDNYVKRGSSIDDNFTKIKYYPNVKASAGHGLIAQDERSLDIAFRSYFIKNTLRSSAKDLIAIDVPARNNHPMKLQQIAEHRSP